MKRIKRELKRMLIKKHKRAISILDEARKGLISMKPDLRLPIVL